MTATSKLLAAWDYDPYDDHFSVYAENDGLKDYLFRIWISNDVPEAARLEIVHRITAAPDMLDALHLAQRELSEFYFPEQSEALRVVISAIAKATGGLA